MDLSIKRFFEDIKKSEKISLTLSDLDSGGAPEGSPSVGYKQRWFRLD